MAPSRSADGGGKGLRIIRPLLELRKGELLGFLERRGQPFPDKIRDALQHIVLAHHGHYEFGSPRLPATPEAIVVHYLDNIDAKVSQFVGAIADDPDPESEWTQYVRPLETRVYKGDVLGLRKD